MVKQRTRVTYWLGAVGSVVGSGGGDVVSVGALRWLETHVVVARLIVLAEAELGSWGKERVSLLRLTERILQHFIIIII